MSLFDVSILFEYFTARILIELAGNNKKLTAFKNLKSTKYNTNERIENCKLI